MRNRTLEELEAGVIAHWWSFGNKERKKVGQLKVSEEDALLQLEGVLDPQPNGVQLREDIAKIKGKSHKGVEYLLLDNSVTYSSGYNQSHRYMTSAVRPRVVMCKPNLGLEFTEEVQSISCKYEHLRWWLNISRQDSTNNEFQIDNNAKLSIFISEMESRSPLKDTVKKVVGSVWVSIQFINPVNYKKALEYLVHLERLLSLLLYRRISQRIFTLNKLTDVDADASQNLAEMLLINYRRRLELPREESEMMLPYVDFSQISETIIENWYNNQDKLARICDLYIKNTYGNTIVIEESFTDFTKALEASTYRFDKPPGYTGNVKDDRIEEEKGLIEDIKNCVQDNCPEKYWEYIDRNLEPHSSASIHDRLKGVRKMLLELSIINIPESDIEQIIEIRHKLTHPQEDQPTTQEVSKHLTVLDKMTRACLLIEAGFDNATVSSSINKHR